MSIGSLPLRFVWSVALLLVGGVQLTSDMMQAADAFALSVPSGTVSDHPCGDADRRADVLDETSELDDSLTGSEQHESLPAVHCRMFRLAGLPIPASHHFLSGPFRPPRLPR